MMKNNVTESLLRIVESRFIYCVVYLLISQVNITSFL